MARRMMRFGLRARLTLLIEILVIILVLITGTISTIREKKTLEGELRKRGSALATDLSRFMLRPLINNDLPALRRFVINTMKQDYVRYVAVLDPEAKVIMHSNLGMVGKTCVDEDSPAAVAAGEPRCVDTINPDSGELYCAISAPIQVEEVRLGSVRLGYSFMAVKEEIARARGQIVIIGLATILLGGFFAYFLAAFISSPLKKITEATRKVSEGDLDIMLSINRDDEIGILASSFEKMARDLRQTTISRDYVDNIIGSTIDTLIVVDKDARITRVNKATCDLLEYEEDQLLENDIGMVLAGEAALFGGRGLQKLFSEEKILNHETGYISSNGREIPMLLSASVLRSKENEVLGAVVIAKDITELRKAEEALRESEQALHLLTSQLINAQEEERRRLARELHDELGQSLVVIKLRLRSIRERLQADQDKLRAECDEMSDYINDVTESTRRLSRDLSPALLEDLGLTAAARRLVEASTGTCGMKISCDIDKVEDLFTREEQITIYRVVQECLTNVLKHAGAGSLSLSIKRNDGGVVLTLEDDGRGFDVQNALDRADGTRTMGLAAMFERTRMLRGSLDIRSQINSGTRITLTLPVDGSEGRA